MYKIKIQITTKVRNEKYWLVSIKFINPLYLVYELPPDKEPCYLFFDIFISDIPFITGTKTVSV